MGEVNTWSTSGVSGFFAVVSLWKLFVKVNISFVHRGYPLSLNQANLKELFKWWRISSCKSILYPHCSKFSRQWSCITYFNTLFFREFPECSSPQTLWILDLHEDSLQALPGYLYQNLQIFQIQLLELQLVLLWHTCHRSLSWFFLQELLGPTMNRVYLWGIKSRLKCHNRYNWEEEE